MQISNIKVGLEYPLFLIAGPCVIENEHIIMKTAETLKNVSDETGVPIIFKSSFDKANRTSIKGFRGPGMEVGLKILEQVRTTFEMPILTDVHENTPIDEVASVVDVLQTPAFLCRQTDFITRVAAAGKPVNIKKGQFMSPSDMINVVEKARSTGNDKIMVCERGASFGYNNLVSDMRSLVIMRNAGPVIFDATHSVQMPGGNGTSSGGDRTFAPVLARGAAAVGVSGIFIETHPDPDSALSDGPNMIPLHEMREVVETLKSIDECVK